MARLIDADELLKDARCDKAISACLADIVDIQNLVNDQPTIDAVPVVRCKDCKHGITYRRRNGEIRFFGCGYHEMEANPDDFCSYGERWCE